MAGYKGTHSCGHEGKVNLIGPAKQRQWKIDRHFENVCTDCFLKQKSEENQKAMEESKKMELPELTGSEKQVAWANSIRLSMAAKIDSPKILDYLLKNETKASWWIENRNSINLERVTEKMESEELKEEEDLILSEDKSNHTIQPENKITSAVVEIEINDNTIKARFEKNEKFINIVKALDYEWVGVWQRVITNTNGSVEDRVAELGNKLLNAGFPIRIMNKEILQNAVEGKYEQECKRWVYLRTKGEYEGRFAIQWTDGMNDKLYKCARSLPGSIYDHKSVVVKIEHHKEVQDFATLNGFKFTGKALIAAQNQKELELKIATVKPVETRNEQPKDGLEEILNSGDEIIDDLKD